jgi:hypothetical protein
MLDTPVTVTIPNLGTLILVLLGGLGGHVALTKWVVRTAAREAWMEQFEACEDRVEPRIRVMLAKELNMVRDDNTRLLLFESEMRNGFSSHSAELRAGLESVVSTLAAIQKEASETAKAVARMEGRMESWNGDDRRSRVRRSDDLHHD